jgi:hypothetical protein
MFGTPVVAMDKLAIFHLVWTYVVKKLDSLKKAWCECDGSQWSGQVRILDHTYANCVNQKVLDSSTKYQQPRMC